MKIEYDKKAEKYFDNFNLLKKIVGTEIARKVKSRMNQLEAADLYGIYKTTALGKPHCLKGNLSNCIGIVLTGNFRLVIEPIPPDLSAESLKNCKGIIVKGVIDYHEEKNKWLVP